LKIPENILAVLAECRVEGKTLFLPPEQLDRKVYTAVNKCLENIGGKWNRKAKGHVFDHDPTEGLENLILTGETEDMIKTFQFFPTPRSIADQMCDMAELTPSSRVLEPSCGKGDLLDALHDRGITDLIGVELNAEMAQHLEGKPYTTMIGIDFLAFAADPGVKRDFSHVIMNPPFSRQQDIAHIRAAFEMLRPGGILVSVASPSWQWRENTKSQEFRDWMECDPAIKSVEVIKVPEGAFKASGTMIPTVIIKLCRDGELAQLPTDEPATEAQPERVLSFAEKFRLTKAS